MACASGDLDLATIASVSAIGDYSEMRGLRCPVHVPRLRPRPGGARRTDRPGNPGQDAADGLVGLAWTENGFRHLANSKRPIRSPEDVKGLKLRTPKNPVMIEAFRTLGAEVMPMPWSQADLRRAGAGRPRCVRRIRSTRSGELRDLSVAEVSQPDQPHLCAGHHLHVEERHTTGSRTPTSRRSLRAARLGPEAETQDHRRSGSQAIAQLLDVGMKINTDVDKAAFRAALAPAYAKWRSSSAI